MFKLSSKIAVALFVVSVAGVALCQPADSRGETQNPDGRKEGVPEKRFLEVNGQPVYFSTFQEALKTAESNLGHRELSRERIEEIKKEVVDRLIEKELVLQEAKKLAVDPDLLVKREIYDKATVSDEEVKAYYDTHPGEFLMPEGVRLKHLLVRVDPSSTNAGWKAGYEKALELSDLAGRGESFESLIQKYGDPESRYFGGDQQIQYKGSVAMAEFEPQAFSMAVNQVSPPIQTLYGFSLIQVVEKIPPRPFTFAEINRDKLKKDLMKEKEAARSEVWIRELRSQANIRFFQK